MTLSRVTISAAAAAGLVIGGLVAVSTPVWAAQPSMAPPDTVAFAKKKTDNGTGDLAVEVNGLPNGVDARVKVKGPKGFKVRLSDSRRINNLRAGVYKVRAKTVHEDDGDATAADKRQKVRVQNNETTHVVVVYDWQRDSTPRTVAKPTVTPSEWESQVLKLTNDARGERRSCGSEGVFKPAPQLDRDSRLGTVARAHAKDMAANGFFEHNSRNGRDPGARMWNFGYKWRAWAENIAAGQQSPREVVRAWLNSDGHCANVMSREVTELGVGYAPGGEYGHYWVQDFGRPA